MDSIEAAVAESARVSGGLAGQAGVLREMARRIAACLGAGSTVYLCGNGGSAADAQHVAAEFVGRFTADRIPLPAEALTTNASALTAIGNDYEFGEVFARQVDARVGAGDVLAGISTSGNSENVVRAMARARKRGAATLGFTGSAESRILGVSDVCLRVGSRETPRIQEAHILAWHIICGLVEEEMFGNGPPRSG